MNLKKLINKSWYGSIGYIEDNATVDLFVTYLLYNKPVLDEFKNHIFAFTYKTLDLDYLQSSIKTLYPNANILILDINRGHNFGTADLDNAIVEFCKNNNGKWLCKASNDMIYNSSILNKEIGIADFYYLNGISYETLYLNKFDYEKIFNNQLIPQTNFYFIDISKIDYLYNKEYVDETYQYKLNIPNYNNKIWEYIPGWSCELFLKACVERNSLSKEYLLDLDTHKKLCNFIEIYKIGDPSHKNIMIEGICHLQYPEQHIIQI